MPRTPSQSIEAKVDPGSPFFDIIETAYRVFNYPKPASSGVCVKCCMDPIIEGDFFNPSIRELPLDYIRDWYQGAYDSKGVPKETWAYLLPRVLEVLAAGVDVSPVGIEVSLNRFDTGNSERWSAKEWNVLSQFQQAYLKQITVGGERALDDVICMFSLAGWPLQTLIDQVRSSSDSDLAQRLWNDWCRWVLPGREGVWMTTFWTRSDRTTMFNFYTSRELHDRMEVLALAGREDTQLAERAFAVASIIEANASTPGSAA